MRGGAGTRVAEWGGKLFARAQGCFFLYVNELPLSPADVPFLRNCAARLTQPIAVSLLPVLPLLSSPVLSLLILAPLLFFFFVCLFLALFCFSASVVLS